MNRTTDIELQDTPGNKSPRDRRGAWPWIRRGVIGIGLFVVAIVLALQTQWGATRAVRFALTLFNPFDGATIEVHAAGGNFLTRLVLSGVVLERADGQIVAQVDTVAMQFNLLPLLWKDLHLIDVELVRPKCTFRRNEDGTWDLSHLMPRDTTSSEKSPRAINIIVDRAAIVEGSVRAQRVGSSELFLIDNMNVRLRSLRWGDESVFRLDTLSARMISPNGTGPVKMGMSASMDGGAISLDSFSLTSQRSAVHAHGSFPVPREAESDTAGVNLSITAKPLVFGDLSPLLTYLDPSTVLDLDIHVGGTAENLAVQASARLNNGGAAHIDGTFSSGVTGTYDYKLSAQLDDLDVGRFSSVPGRIHGGIEVELHGLSSDSLDGLARATFNATTLNGNRVDRTELVAAFSHGRANINVKTGLRGANLSLSGWMRPLDAVPTYSIDGQFERLDIGQFSDGSSTSNLRGSVKIVGRAFTPEMMDLSAHVTLAPSVVNAVSVEAGTLDARWEKQAVDLTTDLRFSSGRFHLKGGIEMSNPPLFRIDDGQLDRVPLAGLIGDTTTSALSATFALSGQGGETGSLQLSGDARLGESIYGRFRLHSGRIGFRVQNGTVRVTSKANMEGGVFDVEATARPFDDLPTVRLTRGVFRDIDLGKLAGLASMNTQLGGTIALTASGTDPEKMNLSVTGNLANSQVNDQVVNAAAFEAAMHGGEIQFQTEIDLRNGAVQLDGRARIGNRSFVGLDEGRFSGINLGNLLGLDNVDTDLNGTVTLSANGVNPKVMHLTSRLDLAASRINTASLTSGELVAEMAGGVMNVDGSIRTAHGRMTARAGGRFFDDDPGYSASVALDNMDLGSLLGLDSLVAKLSMDFAVKGTGLDPETMQFDGQLSMRDSQYGAVSVKEALANISIDHGAAHVDTLRILSNVGILTGSGPVAISDSPDADVSNLQFDLSLSDLTPLETIINVEHIGLSKGEIQGVLRGPTGKLGLNTRVHLSSLVYNDTRLARLDGRLVGEFAPDRSLAQAEFRATTHFLSTRSLTVERTEAVLGYQPGNVSFSANIRMDERRNGFVKGDVNLDPAHREISVDSLLLRLDSDRWSLLQPATISYGAVYQIRNMVLFTEDEKQIALDGEIDLNGEQSLILTIERFPIASIADLSGYRGLGGTLDGWLVMEGDATAPVVNGELDLDLIAFGKPGGKGHVSLAYKDLHMLIEANLKDRDDNALTIDGTIPVDLRLVSPVEEGKTGVRVATGKAAPDSGVDLEIQAEAFEVDWALPLVNRSLVDKLEGKLNADIEVHGTVSRPVVSGAAFLTEGRVGIPFLGRGQGLVYGDVSFDAQFDEHQIRVNNVEMTAGGGSVRCNGTINLKELTLGDYDISCKGKDFLAIDSREYRAKADADLSIRGTTDQPELSGDVRLISADIFFIEKASDKEFETVQLTEADQQVLEQRFGLRLTRADTTTFDFYDALTISQLTVNLARDTWLRSRSDPKMDIQFTGDLEVQKRPAADPLVFGSITVIPERSHIDELGKRFSIERGTLNFNGPPTDPEMDVSAFYVVRSRGSRENEVTITMAVSGKVENLDLKLGSDPQMELADILSYLAFGRPASEALQLGQGTGGNNSMLDPAAGVALGQITSLVENLAGTGLGLDVIEIDQNGLEGTTITAGKYISPRLYVAMSQPISFRKNTTGTGEEVRPQYTLEYEVFNHLLLRLLRREPVLHISLQWQYAF